MPKIDTGDTAWMLASAALVMFMTPGLGLFYGGLVRAKNVLATVMQSFIALALVSVLRCDQGLQPRPLATSISGTVTFAGAEPAGTENVFVVAFPSFPKTTADLYSFVPFPPQSLRRPFTGSSSYTIAVPSGRYEWVVAVWKQQGSLVEANLREAGFYQDPANPPQRGVVVVNGPLKGIDFVIDFDNMHPVCTYIPPCPP